MTTTTGKASPERKPRTAATRPATDARPTPYKGVRWRGDVLYYKVKLASGRWAQIRYGTGSPKDAYLAREQRQQREDKVRSGLLDPEAEATERHARRPIGDHLADWNRDMASRGMTPRHVFQMHSSAAKLIASMPKANKRLHDVTCADVHAALHALEHRGASMRTCRYYRQAIKAFSRWAVRNGRMNRDPLAGLDAFKRGHDVKRRERRALTADEYAWLVRTTEAAPRYRRMTGPERAMLYRLAMATGFRRGELMSLTPRSFDLDGNPPTITVQAESSKHRRQDVQPIRPDVAATLRPWLAAKSSPDARVFDTMPEKTARMMEADLRRAKAKWIKASTDPAERRQRRASDFLAFRDSAGRIADFHALRASFITALVRGGASVKQAQTLARHSDPKLTMNVYTKLGIDDVTGALHALPSESTSMETPATDEGPTATMRMATA